jgi:hypothetical protein
VTFKEFLLDFLRTLLEDLREALRRESSPLPLRNLERFSFPEELPVILEIARRYFPENASYPVNPYALLLAIREAERGRKGFEFGIVAAKDTDLRTQAEWACATVKKNFERFRGSGEKDFIAFLGKRWAPVGAENDPKGLNRFWVDNVRFFYERYNGGVRPWSLCGMLSL